MYKKNYQKRFQKITSILILLTLFNVSSANAFNFNFFKTKKNPQPANVQKTSPKTDTPKEKKTSFFKKKEKNTQSQNEQAAINVTKNENGTVLFNLQTCIDTALKNDPNIRVSKDMLDIAVSQIGQARSDYFPNLTATNGFTSQHNKNSGSGGGFYNSGGSTSSDNNYYSLNLGVNQLIWNFGKTAAKINMQKYNKESAGYDLENTILDTVYNVKMAYFEVLAALANRDVFERSVRINQLNYDRTKALFEEGLKSKIDVVNAEVYLTDAKISLIEADTQYQTALISLNNAMYLQNAPEYELENTESFNFKRNKPQTTDEVNVSEIKKNTEETDQSAILTSGIEKQDILQDYKFQPLVMPLDEAIEKAYSNRPDLKSLLMVKRAQEESLKQIKRSYYPELSGNVGYSYRKNSDVSNTGFNIGATLGFPTINGMDIKYRIDEGKAYLRIAEENIDLSKKNIYFEIQKNYTDMVMIQRRIPMMAQKVQQTLENFELADGRYTVGLGNFIELQQAQTNYNNAQLSFVQAVFDYNVAKEKFQKSMGVR